MFCHFLPLNLQISVVFPAKSHVPRHAATTSHRNTGNRPQCVASASDASSEAFKTIWQLTFAIMLILICTKLHNTHMQSHACMEKHSCRSMQLKHAEMKLYTSFGQKKKKKQSNIRVANAWRERALSS